MLFLKKEREDKKGSFIMNKMKKNELINVKGIIIGIILFLLFYCSSYLQLIPILLFNIKEITGSTQVLLSLFSNTILLIILAIIFRKELIHEWKIFKDKFLANFDIGIKYWIIGLIVMMVSNTILTFVLKMGQATNEQEVQKLISYLPWIMVINAGIIAPCIEEIVFRKCYKNAFPNKWLFIILSSLVFGSMHVITSMTSPMDLLFIIPYGSLGASFAMMYQKTNTIYTSILMHMIHNTILIILSIIA